MRACVVLVLLGTNGPKGVVGIETKAWWREDEVGGWETTTLLHEEEAQPWGFGAFDHLANSTSLCSRCYKASVFGVLDVESNNNIEVHFNLYYYRKKLLLCAANNHEYRIPVDVFANSFLHHHSEVNAQCSPFLRTTLPSLGISKTLIVWHHICKQQRLVCHNHLQNVSISVWIYLFSKYTISNMR